MVLTRDQIYRYMSQMLIPEIRGKGQEMLLGSRVLIYCESLEEASLALHYLAAAGVGEVRCIINDPNDCSRLQDKLSDLNSDTMISFSSEGMPDTALIQSVTRIIAGSRDYVLNTLKDILRTGQNKHFVPTVVSISEDWHGALQTFTERSGLESFVDELPSMSPESVQQDADYANRLSGYFSSLMAVIEHLKLALNVGKPMDNALYYNLSAMDFISVSNTRELVKKLYRNAVTAKPQHEHFSASRVLIAGCGGLGSPAAYVLASLGIGKLGLWDPGTVELGDLNHEVMHASSRLGMPKARSAEIFLRDLNPGIELEIFDTTLSDIDLNEIIGRYDIVIGCMDSRKEIYLLNDACIAAGKPLLQAGALDISGLATSIIPGEGHCYRCLFPEAESSDSLPMCRETGVLGPVPGIMGIIQAAEAVKLLSGIGRSLKDRLLLFDVFDTDLYIVNNIRNYCCELCGGK